MNVSGQNAARTCPKAAGKQSRSSEEAVVLLVGAIPEKICRRVGGMPKIVVLPNNSDIIVSLLLKIVDVADDPFREICIDEARTMSADASLGGFVAIGLGTAFGNRHFSRYRSSRRMDSCPELEQALSSVGMVFCASQKAKRETCDALDLYSILCRTNGASNTKLDDRVKVERRFSSLPVQSDKSIDGRGWIQSMAAELLNYSLTRGRKLNIEKHRDAGDFVAIIRSGPSHSDIVPAIASAPLNQAEKVGDCPGSSGALLRPAKIFVSMRTSEAKLVGKNNWRREDVPEYRDVNFDFDIVVNSECELAGAPKWDLALRVVLQRLTSSVDCRVRSLHKTVIDDLLSRRPAASSRSRIVSRLGEALDCVWRSDAIGNFISEFKPAKGASSFAGCAFLDRQFSRLDCVSAGASDIGSISVERFGRLLGLIYNIVFDRGRYDVVCDFSRDRRDSLLQSVKELAEFFKCSVRFEQLEGDINAFAVITRKRTTLIVRSDLSAERQAFLILHEMAHVLLEHVALSKVGLDIDRASKEDRGVFGIQEFEADEFARMYIDAFNIILNSGAARERRLSASNLNGLGKPVNSPDRVRASDPRRSRCDDKSLMVIVP